MTAPLTPIERIGLMYLKRDDLYEVAGAYGGKARTCWALSEGAKGLVTAGSRSSPQVNIVAHIAKELGVPCRVHTPTGELSPEVEEARRYGAKVLQWPAGYNNVIISRARDDARKHGYTEIPFGMECNEAIRQTAGQVRKIPAGVKRIVMPVGSGMSLAGVLWGLKEEGLTLPVLGVRVGADPGKRLARYAPDDVRRNQCKLIHPTSDYHKPADATNFFGVELDPIYEAKCIPYLLPGDLLWVVGIRSTCRK